MYEGFKEELSPKFSQDDSGDEPWEQHFEINLLSLQ